MRGDLAEPGAVVLDDDVDAAGLLVHVDADVAAGACSPDGVVEDAADGPAQPHGRPERHGPGSAGHRDRASGGGTGAVDAAPDEIQHVDHVGVVDRRVGEDVVDHRGEPAGLVADGGQPAFGVTAPGLGEHQDRRQWLAEVVAQRAYGVDAGGVAQGVGVGQSACRHRSSPVSSPVR